MYCLQQDCTTKMTKYPIKFLNAPCCFFKCYLQVFEIFPSSIYCSGWTDTGTDTLQGNESLTEQLQRFKHPSCTLSPFKSQLVSKKKKKCRWPNQYLYNITYKKNGFVVYATGNTIFELECPFGVLPSTRVTLHFSEKYASVSRTIL